MQTLHSIRLVNRTIVIMPGNVLQRLDGTQWEDYRVLLNSEHGSQAVEMVKTSDRYRIIRMIPTPQNVFRHAQWAAIRKADCHLAIDTHRLQWRINRQRPSTPANDRRMIEDSL